ncbi:hypothetical protein POSPLADRAFT_1137734 [Postia placenta MAD-698-R-SB12]|uniref:choline-phosphate cytidylyltransferase n=1 Tax=Postia placenta MAD-698-R-SB12 TaxID=670580 RepID=A0A1X6N6K0_9APHY|nr:hypothetical protein POSPLADRAFT_1137734 [Postia placenta MAD-698-R-SB12]OSX64269.1 hypothetical protein POSPLADRAFT_1137734 [Postia placenta MAD-698-R-SB12]
MLSGDDLSDYDVISDGHRSLESSIADLSHVDVEAADIHEPPPPPAARDRFDTVSLSADDIQKYVRKAVPSIPGRRWSGDGTVRVYVDGIFDPFQARDALQLRQAKLSLPCVHLMVGVFVDELCESHQIPIIWPHVDRCEVLRHCRWVDEVVPDAPWMLDDKFLRAKRIDYVAIDEGSTVNPAYDADRLRGYDLVKSLRMYRLYLRPLRTLKRFSLTGRAIPIKRTTVLTPIEPRGLSVFMESANGTLRGAIPTRARPRFSVDEPDPDPFEEPRTDEFGTGYGI